MQTFVNIENNYEVCGGNATSPGERENARAVSCVPVRFRAFSCVFVRLHAQFAHAIENRGVKVLRAFLEGRFERRAGKGK